MGLQDHDEEDGNAVEGPAKKSRKKDAGQLRCCGCSKNHELSDMDRRLCTECKRKALAWVALIRESGRFDPAAWKTEKNNKDATWSVSV